METDYLDDPRYQTDIAEIADLEAELEKINRKRHFDKILQTAFTTVSTRKIILSMEL